MKRIAIIGGGIAGLTAAYELARFSRDGAQVEAVLFESSNRFGGLIETVREGGFTVESGPDAWLSAKPHARDLAIELGLEAELIGSNDATRRTHIFLPTPQHPNGALVPMPDGFHMMVPANLAALEASPLLTPAAIAAYRAEPARAADLLASIPPGDESVASFTLRHFGPEVLSRIAAPLLSGIFGGDVRKLSVRATMPAFVAMEREHGSLITALSRTSPGAPRTQPIFTTLRTGLGTLVDRLVAAVPPQWLRPQTTVTAITRGPSSGWIVEAKAGKRSGSEAFDAIFLATPLDATRRLLTPLVPSAPELLPTESSSAVLVAFAYPNAADLPLPEGFGFLVPPAVPSHPGAPSMAASSPWVGSANSGSTRPGPPPNSLLLACTFTDQKFPHRTPPGARLIRAFFGGAVAERLIRCNNDEVAAIARLELARILNADAPTSGPAPTPAPPPVLTIVRRWPSSLPQYAVGHLTRAAELRTHLNALPGLILLGNSTGGVGLPDLIHAARQAANAAKGNAQ